MLIFAHALTLMLGDGYTYARVPLGFAQHDAFFGTQGGPWDTLSAMVFALIGAIV